MRLNVSSLNKRLAVLDEYIDNDLLGCEAGMYSSLLAAEDEQTVDQAVQLLNVVSGEYRGRTYILLDEALMPTLISILKS